MVYIYAKQSAINKYVGKGLSVDEIKDTLIDMGMDIKGEQEGNDPELKDRDNSREDGYGICSRNRKGNKVLPRT
jgi:hypothetical protein